MAKSLGSVNKGVSSMLSTQGSHNIYNLDCDLAYDEVFDNHYVKDFMDVDDYDLLQAHFDNVDVPAGVEASVSWFADFSEGKNKTSQQNISASVDGKDEFLLPLLSEPAPMDKKVASFSGSNFQIRGDTLSHSPGGASLPSPLLFPQGSQSKKKSTTSQHRWNSQNLPFEYSLQSYQAGASTNGSNVSHPDSLMLPHAVNPAYWNHFNPAPIQKQIGANSLLHSKYADAFNPTMVAEPSMAWLPSPPMKPKYSFNKHNISPSFSDPVGGAYITPQEVAEIRNQRNVNEEDILSKLELFKQFDTVEDYSDHHYASSGASTKQVTSFTRYINNFLFFVFNILYS